MMNMTTTISSTIVIFPFKNNEQSQQQQQLPQTPPIMIPNIMAAAFRSLSFTELMEQKNLDMPDRLKQESEQQYHQNCCCHKSNSFLEFYDRLYNNNSTADYTSIIRCT